MVRTGRINTVMEMVSMGKSTIWAWVAKGKFPKPIKLSPRVTVWKLDEVEAWLEEQANGGAK